MDDDPIFLSIIFNLSALLQLTGKFEEAEPLAKEVLKLRMEYMGPDAKDTIGCRINMATLHENLQLVLFLAGGGIVIDGLRWGDAFGIEDIAFGLQRIHAQCVIVNDLVGLDDVTDAVEALPQVGSTAPGTMNRLG